MRKYVIGIAILSFLFIYFAQANASLDSREDVRAIRHRPLFRRFVFQSNNNNSSNETEADYFHGIHGSIALILWIIYTPIFIVILILFLIRREKSPIKQRQPFLLATTAIGGYLIMTSYCFETFVGPQNYPCILSLWLIWFAFPLYFIPYPLRAFRLIFIFKLNWIKNNTALLEKITKEIESESFSSSQIKIKVNHHGSHQETESDQKKISRIAATTNDDDDDDDKDSSKGDNGSGTERESVMKKDLSKDPTITPRNDKRKGNELRDSIESNKNDNKDDTSFLGGQISVDSVPIPESAHGLSLFFIRYRKYFLNCGYLMYVVLFITILIGLVRQFIIPENLPPNTGCQNSVLFFVTSLVFFLIFVAALLFEMYFLRNIRDEFNISNELRIVCITWIILLLPFLVINLYYAERNQISEWTVYFLIGWTLISFAASNFWPLYRSFYATPEVEWPGVEVVASLENLLRHRRSILYFKEFLVSEFSVENLTFYLDILDYKKITVFGEAVNRALEIYDKYFSEKSVFQLNVDSGIYRRINDYIDAIRSEVAFKKEDNTSNRSSSSTKQKQRQLHISISSRKAIVSLPLSSSFYLDLSTLEGILRIFDEAQKEIFELMKFSSFPRFKKNVLCRRLVMKLKHEEETRRTVSNLNLL